LKLWYEANACVGRTDVFGLYIHEIYAHNLERPFAFAIATSEESR